MSKTYVVAYSIPGHKLNPSSSYYENEHVYIKDLTKGVYIRVPAFQPSQRDILIFIAGYNYNCIIQSTFETVTIERGSRF